MPTVAVIGAGQLGSRHLQALGSLDASVEIHVVEPWPESSQRAQQRWNDVADDVSAPGCEFHTGVAELPSSLDVGIVATDARARWAVTRELLESRRVRFLILEKVLFQQAEHYEQFERLAASCGVQAWVNCPRRMYPFYESLRTSFAGTQVYLEVFGGDWGLGCNAIHFLDLLAYLSGDHRLTIEDAVLDQEISSSKREGFYEFAGSLSGRTAGGSEFRIVSIRNSDEPLTIAVSNGTDRYVIQESRGACWRSSQDNTTNRTAMPFAAPLQSELTGHVVQELLESGRCRLTPFAESANLHLELLGRLLDHYRRHQESRAELCPIT